jgi:hypothetical protein
MPRQRVLFTAIQGSTMERDRAVVGEPAVGACDLLRDLQQEISIAIDCIARNALGDLELSLWRQEMLCAGLKRAIVAICPSIADWSTRECLRERATALQDRAQVYALLIGQCRRSNAVLRDLCGLYGNAKGLPENSNVASLLCEA